LYCTNGMETTSREPTASEQLKGQLHADIR
jgi:hypothetical protein